MKSKSFSRGAAIAALFICSSNLAWAGSKLNDVVGIKLGMTPDQVRAALKAHDPAMKIVDYGNWNPVPGVPASLARIRGCNTPLPGSMRAYDSCKEVVEVTFGHVTKKALFISRSVKFENNVLHQAVSDGLVEKYGEPTYRQGANNSMWAYTPDGAGINSSDCGVVLNNYNTPESIRYKPQCAAALTVNLVPGQGALAREMSVALYQSQPWADERAAFSAAVKANQEEREHAAKGTKVKL